METHTARPRLIAFVLFGCLLGLTVEAHYKLFAFFNPKGLGAAIVLYPIILLGFFGLGRLVDRVAKTRLRADLTLWFLTAAIGLAIEWTLLGNSPMQNPNASQLGMLCLWTGFAFFPRLLARSDDAEAWVRRRIWAIYGTYAVIGTTLGLTLPASGAKSVILIYLPVLAYGFANVVVLNALVRPGAARPLPSPQASSSPTAVGELGSTHSTPR